MLNLDSLPWPYVTPAHLGVMYMVRLPWPISFNAYKNGRQTTKKGRLWREDAIAFCRAQCKGKPTPLLGNVGVWLEIFPPADKRKRDLDNFTGKHILDMLVKAGYMNDDDQIFESHQYKRAKFGRGALCITMAEV